MACYRCKHKRMKDCQVPCMRIEYNSLYLPPNKKVRMIVLVTLTPFS